MKILIVLVALAAQPSAVEVDSYVVQGHSFHLRDPGTTISAFLGKQITRRAIRNVDGVRIGEFLYFKDGQDFVRFDVVRGVIAKIVVGTQPT